MKSFSTRILSLLLTLVMIFSIMPSALAVDEVTEEHVHTEDCTHEETETETPVTEETPLEPVADEPITELPVEPVASETVSTEPMTEPSEIETPVSTATSGYILGSSVYWEVSGGQLLISGSGSCPTFTSAADQPWAHLRTEITAVWFNSMDDLSISNLAYWFDGCTSLTSAEIPYTTSTIGTRAFAECPNLNILQIYHQESVPTVVSDAFYLSADSGVKLQILTIMGYPKVVLPFHQYPWSASNRRSLYFGDVYGMSLLSTGYLIGTCPSCGENALQGGYTEESHPHADYNQCYNCGYTEYLGSYSSKNHGDGSWGSWSCPDCGSHSYSYSGGSSATCTSNGYATYSCACGDSYTQTEYATGHSYYTSYSSYSSSQHEYYESCYNCSYYSSSYESHYFSYGSWSKYDASQHRRSVSCYYCSYSTYEYANHALSYGSWANYSSTQHRRTVKCSTCGYSTYEYANHSTTTGSWTTHSDSQHKRTISCSCGYSSTEYADHSLTTGEWISSSDTQHSRTVSCSCGYSGTVSENHSFTYGDKTPLSDTQHTVEKICDCGYETTETVDHSFTVSDWASVSGTHHGRTHSCECGYTSDELELHSDADDDAYCDTCNELMTFFSVTVPASLVLTVSESGEVYAAETAVIVNNSSAAVSVTNVSLTAENGWTLVPYTMNMADAKMDAKLIGFSINGAQSMGNGTSESLVLGSRWTIARGNSLDLSYDAVVSGSRTPINEQVLTVVFVLNWAA